MNLLLLGGMALAGTMFAAEGSGLRMESPVLGYVFDDQAKAIRTVSGIAGAASLGETIALPALAEAYVHSGAKVALAVTKEGTLALASWRETGRLVTLDTSFMDLRMAAFSRSGARVAISDGATVEVWSTAETPVLLSRKDGAGEIAAIAVNEAGVVLAASSGRIVRWDGDATDTIATGGDWTALAYADNGDGVASDATRNELVRITPEGGRSVIAALPGRAEVVASGDAGVLFAAASAWGALAISAAGVAEPLACDCQPKGLDRMTGGAMHLRGTLIVADVDAGLRLTTLPSLFVVGLGDKQ